MPTWQHQLAVQDKNGVSGLWLLARTPTETSAKTARRAIRAVICVLGHQPLLTYVASSGGMKYWRAEYEDSASVGTGDRMALLLDPAVFVTSTQQVACPTF